MQGLIQSLGAIVGMLIKLTAGVGVLIFLWGLTVFIFQSGNPDSHESGKNKMIWGIITLFVMFSIWALIALLQNEFGLNVVGQGGGSSIDWGP